MRGSKLAGQIIADMKREEFFKKKVIRNNCIINKEMQCDKCDFRDNCLDKD